MQFDNWFLPRNPSISHLGHGKPAGAPYFFLKKEPFWPTRTGRDLSLKKFLQKFQNLQGYRNWFFFYSEIWKIEFLGKSEIKFWSKNGNARKAVFNLKPSLTTSKFGQLSRWKTRVYWPFIRSVMWPLDRGLNWPPLFNSS